jgi:uncharacterized damage-inducible protein DinB
VSDLEVTLARLAAIPDAALGAAWAWRPPAPADVRYALFRALEQEQEAAVAARSAWRPPEAARVLGLAQLAFGDLRGLLVGLESALLDRVPAEGEWSVRETLKHVIRVERSYRANIEFAVVRRDDEPFTLPAERRPQPDPADTEGDGTQIARRLAARRAESDAALARLDEAALARPSEWGPLGGAVRIDVRFRLHRFASHLVEHTIQCETTLERLGVAAGDARRTVRRISAARAMHERISPREVLERLDADHAAKADAIGA